MNGEAVSRMRSMSDLVCPVNDKVSSLVSSVRRCMHSVRSAAVSGSSVGCGVGEMVVR